MSHRGFGSRWVVLAAVFAGLAAGFTGVEAGEDARTAVRFIEDLRDHGLHELARDYIHQLGEDASLPAKVKEILAYEEARTLIDEAAKSNDLVLREDLLKEARDMLGAFVKAHPDLVQTRDAMVQTGKLLLERGHTAMLLSEDAADPAKKAAKVAEARAAFGPRCLQDGDRAPESRTQEVCGLPRERRSAARRARRRLRPDAGRDAPAGRRRL
jgi:cellulose synthase operon protein C